MTLTGFWRSELDPERVMHVEVVRWRESERDTREDALTVEEPFELRVNGRSLAMIMRTPGNDAELAMGFLLTEGVIQQADDVVSIADALDDDGLPLANVVEVTMRARHEVGDEACQVQASAFERHFAVSASCGLCGKNSIADLITTTPPLEPDALHIPASTIYKLAECLRPAQSVFAHTGGLHAAALCSASGELLLLREDVGRHNAVDKLIGHGLLHGSFPYHNHVLLLSGRTSFEVLQKALLARIPCVAAISAPSSLAVELADRAGITLIGFLRNHTMNIYTHPRRIVAS
jgi:FdhD protein